MGAGRGEGAQICWGQALDQILFYSPSGGDQDRNVPVLDEVPDRLSEAGRNEIRSVAEKDGASYPCLGISPVSLNAVNTRRQA